MVRSILLMVHSVTDTCRLSQQAVRAVGDEVFHHDVIYETGREGSTERTQYGISCSCHNKAQPLPLTEELHSIMTDHSSLCLTTMCLSPPPLHPISLLKPYCHNLSHSLYPCLCPCSCVWPPLPWMLLQDQKKNYKAVQSCEEGGSGGAYLEPLVALAQNGANMHNVLGPACIFLRKGFAESRQAVRKSRRCHEHACPELSSQERTFPITERRNACRQPLSL